MSGIDDIEKLAQVLVYFLLPLILAACHSGWTINIMSDTLFKAFGSNLTPSILKAAALVLVVYGGYLVITYLTGKSLLKGRKCRYSLATGGNLQK